MRLFLLLFLCSSIVASSQSRSEGSNLTAQQQEVLNVHRRMAEAAQKRDFATWSRYVADDCIFSDEDGDITTKSEIMEHLRNLPLAYDHSENHREFLVHIYGDTAVLNFRLTAHEQFTDSDIVTEMRHTQTLVRNRGGWLLVAEQWGALPINFRQPLATNAGKYKDYVGRYEWRPGGPFDTISMRDGKMLSRLTGETSDNEYLPLGPDTFFLHDDLGTINFVRDAQDHITGYTYHRVDGQEIHVKKIN